MKVGVFIVVEISKDPILPDSIQLELLEETISNALYDTDLSEIIEVSGEILE